MAFSQMLEILKEKEKTINCLLCSGDVNKRYAKPDKYALALTKMLEEERKQNNIKSD